MPFFATIVFPQRINFCRKSKPTNKPDLSNKPMNKWGITKDLS